MDTLRKESTEKYQKTSEISGISQKASQDMNISEYSKNEKCPSVI